MSLEASPFPLVLALIPPLARLALAQCYTTCSSICIYSGFWVLRACNNLVLFQLKFLAHLLNEIYQPQNLVDPINVFRSYSSVLRGFLVNKLDLYSLNFQGQTYIPFNNFNQIEGRSLQLLLHFNSVILFPFICLDRAIMKTQKRKEIFLYNRILLFSIHLYIRKISFLLLWG